MKQSRVILLCKRSLSGVAHSEFPLELQGSIGCVLTCAVISEFSL